MVNGDVVDAPGVNVYLFAQVLHAHGRALDVPAGEAAAPGTIPLHDVVGLVGDPQGEIPGIAAPLVDLHPCAGLLPLQIKARKAGIVGELAGIKDHADLGAVGIAFLLQALDEGNLIGDVLGGPADDVRPLDVRPLDRAEELILVEPGDLPGRLALPPGADFQLVLTLVGVRGHMAHVGDVHHVPHVIAHVLQRPSQDVAVGVGPDVAHMGQVVDRWATGVEAHHRWVDRDQALDLSTGRVEKP